MELYLDTANVAEVERLARIFPIAGVTTNPSIIAASKESIWEVLPRLQKAIGDEGILFAQTMSRDAQGDGGRSEASARRHSGHCGENPGDFRRSGRH